MLPPPLGERGVTLPAAAENSQMTGKEGFNEAPLHVWYSPYPNVSSATGSSAITKKVYLTGNHEFLA
jgi:hypothetical protein